jgi:hypothetical protein
MVAGSKNERLGAGKLEVRVAECTERMRQTEKKAVLEFDATITMYPSKNLSLFCGRGVVLGPRHAAALPSAGDC